MKSYSFLFWAYNVVWLCLAAWMLLVFLRVRSLDRRLDSVERSVSGDDRRR